MPQVELTEQQRLIQQTAHDLAESKFKPGAAAADRNYEPPLGNVKLLADQGFTGISVPESYGGTELSYFEILLIFEQVSRYCANTAMLLGCSGGGTARTIAHLGTKKQKDQYLPKFVAGELLAGWGMSESDAGSDVGNLNTRAVLTDDYYTINGSKMWCTGAQIADVFMVVVRLTDAPGLRGAGCVLIDRNTPGFTVGKHLDLMGLRGTGMAPLFFENCRVPAENLIVPAGEMRKLFELLNDERILGNPSICLGVAQAAFDDAVAFTKQRRQFNKAISDFQGIQWKLADMAVQLDTARALIYRAAQRLDAGNDQITDASITKIYLNEMAIKVTDTAIQLAGASGLSEEYPFERYYRDVRGFAIGYGTNEIQRNMIAREILEGRFSD
jgi:alkylation response protein AidB-like acyl-CoA dehydrogenase